VSYFFFEKNRQKKGRSKTGSRRKKEILLNFEKKSGKKSNFEKKKKNSTKNNIPNICKKVNQITQTHACPENILKIFPWYDSEAIKIIDIQPQTFKHKKSGVELGIGKLQKLTENHYVDNTIQRQNVKMVYVSALVNMHTGRRTGKWGT